MSVDTDVLNSWRESLEREIEEIRAQLGPLEARLERKQAELAALTHLMAITSDAKLSDTGTPPTSTQAATPESFLDTVHQVLSSEGRPIHYVELHRQLAALGVRIPGANPAANLLTHISRDARFVRVARGTYGIAGRDTPQRRASQRRKPRRR